MITKLLADGLGYHEWVLRLPAMVGGLVTVAALRSASLRWLPGYWILLPTAFLFASPTVLRYVTEVKPYAVDLGVAAALLAVWARHFDRTDRLSVLALAGWSVAGGVLCWLSLPVVFVLAAIGIRQFLRDPRWAGVIVGWLASFAVLYLLVLRPAVGTDYLDSFHRAYFLAVPTSWAAAQAQGGLLLGIIRLGFGFTTVALIGGTLLLLAALLGTSRERWLLLPLGVVMLASAGHYYSLIDRLLLFVLPACWLAAGLAARRVYSVLPGGGRLWLVLLGLTVGGTDVYRYLPNPLVYSDGRALAAVAVSAQDGWLAHASAVPVLDYYLRIHPVTRRQELPVKATKRWT